MPSNSKKRIKLCRQFATTLWAYDVAFAADTKPKGSAIERKLLKERCIYEDGILVRRPCIFDKYFKMTNAASNKTINEIEGKLRRKNTIIRHPIWTIASKQTNNLPQYNSLLLELHPSVKNILFSTGHQRIKTNLDIINSLASIGSIDSLAACLAIIHECECDKNILLHGYSIITGRQIFLILFSFYPWVKISEVFFDYLKSLFFKDLSSQIAYPKTLANKINIDIDFGTWSEYCRTLFDVMYDNGIFDKAHNYKTLEKEVAALAITIFHNNTKETERKEFIKYITGEKKSYSLPRRIKQQIKALTHHLDAECIARP